MALGHCLYLGPGLGQSLGDGSFGFLGSESRRDSETWWKWELEGSGRQRGSATPDGSLHSGGPLALGQEWGAGFSRP